VITTIDIVRCSNRSGVQYRITLRKNAAPFGRFSGNACVKKCYRPLKTLEEHIVDGTQDIAIVTARLRLDRLVAADAPALYAYRGDDAVARYQGWKPADVAAAETFIADQARLAFGTADSWCQLAIRDKATGELLGDVGVHFPVSTDDPIEFGLSLRPERQGQGFARETMAALLDLAFSEWAYRRAVGSVDPRNVSSMALLRSLGFRQEAHHVESYFFRGEWADDVIFAMLAREWRGHP
jgi:RimJ/RimL family protein N-acetyltransferase